MEDPEDGDTKLYSMETVTSTISGTVNTYYKIDDISLGQYGLDANADGFVDPVLLTLWMRGNSSEADPNRVMNPVRDLPPLSAALSDNDFLYLL